MTSSFFDVTAVEGGKLSVKTSPADPLEVLVQEPVLQLTAGSVFT